MFVSYQASHEKTVKKCLYYFKKMMHYGFVPFFIVIILLFISKDMISSQSQEWNRVVQTGLNSRAFSQPVKHRDYRLETSCPTVIILNCGLKCH